MGIREEIFPSQRSGDYVQTEWARGWGAASRGFGYAADLLTKNASDLGASIDQAGLAIFFLQRHRVELLLKDLLGVSGVANREVYRTHSLKKLWELCEGALPSRDPAGWQAFESDHAPLIQALSEADDGSAAFRFPVDREGVESERPQFIDLGALSRYVEAFQWAALGWIDWILEVDSQQRERAKEFEESENAFPTSEGLSDANANIRSNEPSTRVR